MNPKLRTVIDFMQTNLHRKLLLSELAKSVNVSVSHLGYLFRSEIGMSPGQYLIKLRIEKARELLNDSQLGVKEVGYKVGWAEKGFLRRFKKVCGITPTQYRAGMHVPTETTNSDVAE
jgi:two-component system response regulator YesN